MDTSSAPTTSGTYYLGHPHGYHNHYYLAEIRHGRPLADPHDRLAGWKQRISPYPPKLRQAIIEKYLFDAGMMLDVGMSSVPRGDVLHAAGCLFRVAAALVQVVFALNREFTMNEKKSLPATADFAVCPADFAARTRAVLAAPGDDPASLGASFERMRALIGETHALAPPLAYAWQGKA